MHPFECRVLGVLTNVYSHVTTTNTTIKIQNSSATTEISSWPLLAFPQKAAHPLGRTMNNFTDRKSSADKQWKRLHKM